MTCAKDLSLSPLLRYTQHMKATLDWMADSEKNLALGPGVQIYVSQPHPLGGGARDPRVLLNETAHQLDGHPLVDFERKRTYDTYSGQQQGQRTDWYMLTFPEPITINCLEMTMGFPHFDGGWWLSLAVEGRVSMAAEWQKVEALESAPPYPFQDSPLGRRPFETYTLTFHPITIQALRVIGRAGGSASLTSLARLAVYQRDLSRLNPLRYANPPIPDVFRVINPNLIADLSEDLAALTGLNVDLPHSEHYLDARRYERFWQRYARNYQGEPELWFLLGETLSWPVWNRRYDYLEELPTPQHTLAQKHVHTDETPLARAIAPIVINGRLMGALSAGEAVVRDRFDLAWHQRYAQRYAIPWPEYQAALERTPHLTIRQLEGAAGLLGTIANTIAGYVQRLDKIQEHVDGRQRHHKELISRSIDLMESRLETSLTIAEVAQTIGLSLSAFSTLFTQHTGQHPREYLINLRIERAITYLTETDLSVIEVADKLCYDTSYFSRLFKRQTGYAPSHYALLKRLR